MNSCLSIVLYAFYILSCCSAVDNIQFAFGIMVYQKHGRSVNEVLHDFIRTLKSIYTPSTHSYIIHLDVKSDPSLRQQVTNRCNALQNCMQIPPRNVAWAGLTTGEMMLALMHEAYESAFYFDYFVLLGHESVPLVSVSVMETVIAAYPPGSNFMNCWNVDHYNFFGQLENNTYRLQGVVVDSFSGELLERGINVRREPPADITFYKSIQNFVVSREFVRYAIYGKDTRRVLLYLANVKTSDEMLLPTLLQMNENLARTAVCDTTLHFTHWIRPGGSWHPEYLTLEHLPLLLSRDSSNIFARKVDRYQSAVLLKVLDRVRKEYQFSGVIPQSVPPSEGNEESSKLFAVFRFEYVVNISSWLCDIVYEYLEEVLEKELLASFSPQYTPHQICCSTSSLPLLAPNSASESSVCRTCPVPIRDDTQLLRLLSDREITSICMHDACVAKSPIVRIAAAGLVTLQSLFVEASQVSSQSASSLSEVEETVTVTGAEFEGTDNSGMFASLGRSEKEKRLLSAFAILTRLREYRDSVEREKYFEARRRYQQHLRQQQQQP